MKWCKYLFFESAIKNGNWKGHLLLALTISTIISLSGCESCEEDINQPGVTTLSVSEITPYSAKGGGRVNDAGGGTIKSRGLVWDLNDNPIVGKCAGSTNEGGGLGTFTCSLTDLSPGTTYHVRAYATNEEGPGYGEQLTFTTPAAEASLTTAPVSNITSNSARSGGSIKSDGGAPITERGICWSESKEPTTANQKTVCGSGTGDFTCELTGLKRDTEYYVRAYAINSAGTAYGNEIYFKTDIEPVKISTAPVSNITSNSARSGGSITDDGGVPITERGICWSESKEPTTANQKTVCGSGTGDFTCELTGLKRCTDYYVRAYAINSKGTSYGDVIPFKTAAEKPKLSTAPVSNITSTSAKSGGTITDDGCAPITERGVCWSQSPGPTTANQKTVCGSGTGDFTCELSGLKRYTPYYVRAYATNSAGTSYGNELSFRTEAETPKLSTASIGSITITSAKSGGNITDDGGARITVRGVCWSTSPNPTTSSKKTTDGAGAGSYSSLLYDLSMGSLYYVRAYATNEGGKTGYGHEVEFLTLLKDVEGNTYKLVKIGQQIWMAQNLRTTHLNEKTSISHVTTDGKWLSLSTPAYCWYGNDQTKYAATYGALYNWYTVNTLKLCPSGWHVPSDAEWTVLANSLGGSDLAGGKMKATGTLEARTGLWREPNTGATNISLFTGVPGGWRDGFGFLHGMFSLMGENGSWWSSTTSDNFAWYRYLHYKSASISRQKNDKRSGFSVRCLKD
jgi:uncharacterized protein (TIGR02145 family)